MPFEFRPFIEEEHAVVGQRHLPRHRHLTAADQAGVRYGMMRGATWARGDEVDTSMPLPSKQGTAIAKAMDLTAAGEAPLLLLALIDRAPERRSPCRTAPESILRLHAFEAFLTAYLQGELQALLATLNTMAEWSPHIKARRAHPSAQRRTGREVSTASSPTMHDSRRDV